MWLPIIAVQINEQSRYPLLLENWLYTLDDGNLFINCFVKVYKNCANKNQFNKENPTTMINVLYLTSSECVTHFV